MLSAAVYVVSERGYSGMSVARVTGRAGISRRTFYDVFDDREDCFLAVFEETIARFALVAHVAAASESTWKAKVRAGLSALLLLADEEPALGALLVRDALGSGPRILQARARVLDILAAFFDQGREETTRTGGEAPPLTAEGTVGAVLAVIHARMLERDQRPLIELLNPLMSMIVLPFLGRAAAAKELTRPVPKTPHHRKQQPVEDPLEGLNIRLTYRTLRVLAVIAEEPGISNHDTGVNAGITDQGQISKLLARLERLGLIHNTGLGHTKGEPNAWNLTPKGHQIEQTITTCPTHTNTNH